MTKPEKIAGHRIPKWTAPQEDLDAVLDNIQNSEDSPLQRQIDGQQEARKTRQMAGYCDACRLPISKCLCREGQ